ncbi:hypothetical protein ACVPOR_14420 [Staphylococcus aureus]
MYNNFIPSLTLGCGSYGRNSISHNVSARIILNIKTIKPLIILKFSGVPKFI